MSKKPTLFLLPNVLDPTLSHVPFFSPEVEKIVPTLDGLIAESDKGARLFLRRFKIQDLPIELLNEHSKPQDLKALLTPIHQGAHWGLISDCGMPCFADPGSDLVKLARQMGIVVETFVGPSSLFFALLLSGLSAQRFSFHGYLPVDEKERGAKIELLARRSVQDQATQLCIEAPYRNQYVFESFLKHLDESMWLCVAVDLTLPTQLVMTKTVKDWKKSSVPTLHKRPTIFLFSV